MKPIAFALALLGLFTSLAQSEPIRSDKAWAIYAQPDAAAWQALLQGENLALGKPVTARPAPTYPHTGNKLPSLTDGILAGAQGKMWTDPKAVGWSDQAHARIVIDLGESQPVGRILARFQAIPTTNMIPRVINLGLSLDGNYYYPARSLVEKVNPEDNPAFTFDPLPNETPMIYAVSLDAGYQARYVRLDLTAHGYIICDEIAVLAAAGEAQALPPAPPGAGDYLDNTFDRRDQFEKALAPGNLIAGKPLRYAPQPNYRLTLNETDPADLTDGKLGERMDERIWFESGSVGWIFTPLVTIFADLGEPQPVGQVVARFLGGNEQGSLDFPDEIRILASNDGEDYYLVSARHKAGLDDDSQEAYRIPEVGQAWVQNFILPVGIKARYLAIQTKQQRQYMFTDEIAVVRGRDALPALQPDPAKLVKIVTSGVGFSAVGAALPVCVTMPLRTKLAITDARAGTAYQSACKLLLDLPAEITMATPGYTPEAVTHDGREYQRFTLPCNRGTLPDFYLQAQAPEGQGGVVYMSGDTGNGPENERVVAWEPILIPPVRVPKRLHVSLAWGSSDGLYQTWPNYLPAMANLGFNCVAVFPRYWTAADLPAKQQFLQAARDAGFQIVVNESPAGALSEDRDQAETKSQLATGPSAHVCPSYRGQYFQKEIASFGQHAVWARPDCIFYDIEAFYGGSQEAPRCTRCQERYQQGGFTNWDEFRAAMGREMLAQMKAAVDQALADAGIEQEVSYGSYATQPLVPLGDGIFRFSNLYPDLLQYAMPNLYVAGNQMAVANNISANRAQLPANDIIPWLSTGTYGDYEPSHTRDMILESFANGARGITYYAYQDFDPAHFKYHAEAVDIVAPIEDIFMDGTPLAGLTCDNPKAKICGMGLGDDLAILVSNYQGLPATTKVTVTTPAKPGAPVWDLHTGKRAGQVGAGGAFTVTLGGDIAAHMFYVGNKYAQAVSARP